MPDAGAGRGRFAAPRVSHPASACTATARESFALADTCRAVGRRASALAPCCSPPPFGVFAVHRLDGRPASPPALPIGLRRAGRYRSRRTAGPRHAQTGRASGPPEEPASETTYDPRSCPAAALIRRLRMRKNPRLGVPWSAGSIKNGVISAGHSESSSECPMSSRRISGDSMKDWLVKGREGLIQATQGPKQFRA